MVEKVIIKTKLNMSSMIRHGSVAVITLFVVGICFGIENVMLAFPIALTSVAMGRRNFYVKTINKGVRLVILDLLIVIVAHIASLNIYIGIVINLLMIFLIMYTIVSPYDLNLYKPFLMLFIFAQYSAVPTSQLYLRVLGVMLGITVVTVASIFGRKNQKKMVENSLIKVLEKINLQLKSILKGQYDEKIEDQCTKAMRSLAYEIYVTRYKGYLTTKLGGIEFRLFIAIEYLNLYLKDVDKICKENSENKIWIKEILSLCEGILEFKNNKNQLKIIYKDLKYYGRVLGESSDVSERKNKIENEIFYELLKIIKNIIDAIQELQILGEKQANKIYDKWERSDIDKPKTIFKEYFLKSSIRMRFALRMSVTMTIALFLGEVLGYYKIIWAIITIMSIMQPYYEDTKSKAKDRMIGNALAILITGVIINIGNRQITTVVILIISLYLLYGFKEYYKISLFAGMASICIASLNENINILIFYRIVYVIIGVMAVVIVNKYLFPYNLTNGLEHLGKKIIKLTERIKVDVVQMKNENSKEHEIRDLAIHIALLNEKLYLRNLTHGYPQVDRFIQTINRDVTESVYLSLFNKVEI